MESVATIGVGAAFGDSVQGAVAQSVTLSGRQAIATNGVRVIVTNGVPEGSEEARFWPGLSVFGVASQRVRQMSL